MIIANRDPEKNKEITQGSRLWFNKISRIFFVFKDDEWVRIDLNITATNLLYDAFIEAMNK